MKQRNIFSQIGNHLYNNTTQIYLYCDIAKDMHKKTLPFLEFMEEGIDVECYNCESIVSPDESLSDSYKFGLEKINEFMKSK